MPACPHGCSSICVGDGIPAADSLYATYTGLNPLHWSAVQGSARLATEFRGDTTFGGTSAPPGRRSIVAALPGGTIVSGAMLETVLRLLPLTITWEDSAGAIATPSRPLTSPRRWPRRIPQAELLMVAGGTHVVPLERKELVAERVERFLRERVGL